MTAIKVKPFDRLSSNELYQLIQLRMACFIIEQKAIYQDLDDCDQHAQHFICYEKQQLIGYLRFIQLDEANKVFKLSRICVDKGHRHQSFGKQLIHCAINRAKELDAQCIHITAQKYLENYYRDFGFLVTSEPFEINQILHQEMQLNINHKMRK